MRKQVAAFMFLVFWATLCSALAQEEPKVTLLFDRYYNCDELSEALRKLNAAYPDFTRLESVGKSFQGRDIWAFTINNPYTGPEDRKPALYMDGNIHGNEVQAGEACLYTVHYILSRYGKNEKITELVNRAVFYFVPTVNPDGRAYFFDRPNTPSSSRSGQRPVDDDRDGLLDEDGPDDLDADGNITQMRKKDPAGRFKPHPEDPRLMIIAKPDEEGGWVLLGDEGIDNDGDGLINEDPTGAYDLNRNWGYNWMPEYVQRGAGDYPFSHSETRSVNEFIMAHPNIVAAHALHNSGGMILRGPGAKNVGQFLPPDVAVYDFIGQRGEKIIKNYRYLIAYKDLYTTYGDFDTYLHASRGAFAFVLEMFPSVWEDLDGDGELGDLERLQFDDYLRQGSGFKEWRGYNHPLYGDIEIGGWTKMTQRPTPTFMLEEECHRVASFVVFHAEHLPKLKFRDVRVESLGDQVSRITAVVVNDRVIPTRSAQAVRDDIGRPDFAVISGDGLKVLMGGRVSDKYRNVVEAQEKNPGRLRVPSLAGMQEVILQWVVKGGGEATIVYDSQKGGRLEKTITLK